MDQHIEKDGLDEALRIIYLETAKDQVDTEKEMTYILASEGVDMDPFRYQQLMEKLGAIINEQSFGKLLQQVIGNEQTDAQVAAAAQLPAQVIADLMEDTIYTNNVPIVLFRNLLVAFNISFRSAERAIRKTFDMLQSQDTIRKATLSGFNPAFRKGYYVSKESFVRNTPKSDGKELYENKEALEKYLSRLNELMN